MYRLETSEPHLLQCVGQPGGAAAECSSEGAAGVAAAYRLMGVGRQWTIPRLDGVPAEFRSFDGIEAAARLAQTLISTGLADPAQWPQVGRDPFRFIEQTLKERVAADGGPEIGMEFYLRLALVSDLYDGDQAGASDEMFLVLEPDSAGYVVIGPTLRLLETVHPRLPATYYHRFTCALNRWIRIYDYRDAVERVDQMREWYEGDPEGDAVELPAVDAAIPDCLRRKCNPLSERFVGQLASSVRNQKARALLEEAANSLRPGPERSDAISLLARVSESTDDFRAAGNL